MFSKLIFPKNINSIYAMLNRKPHRKLLYQPPPLDGEKETCKTDYSFELKLGDGAFGQVWRIKHKKTSKLYACKQVAKEKVMKMLDQFRREVLIMYELFHPNIISLYHHFEDTKYFYLVMELAEGGNLFQKLATEKTFMEKSAFQYFSEVLSAVEYLHSHVPSIIHRDIKPENILISKAGNLKLTDFGWSNYYSQEQAVPRYTMCGTYEYLSPEMATESGHTPAVDIWCLGILLYEMLSGCTPFKGSTKEIMMENIAKTKVKFPKCFPRAAKELVLKILEKNPIKRFSIQKIKQHEWYKSFLETKDSSLKETLTLNNKDIGINNSTTTPKAIENKKIENELNDQIYSKTIRLSISRLKQEVTRNQESGKGLKEKILSVNKNIREKNREIKLKEQDILKKRIESLDIEHSLKDLHEYISDARDQLEKLQTNIHIEAIQEKIASSRSTLLQKTEEVAWLKEKIKDLANDLELCTDNCSDRERYLVNLNQHFTKIKSKGSGLHRSKISQMTSLQQSQEFLKNQIAEHENVIELIDKPDAKYIRELINYVKQSRDTINDGFLVEEKLKNIEDNIFIKEIEIEKIKNNYIEQRSFLQKFSRGEKDSILRKSLQD